MTIYLTYKYDTIDMMTSYLTYNSITDTQSVSSQFHNSTFTELYTFGISMFRPCQPLANKAKNDK